MTPFDPLSKKIFLAPPPSFARFGIAGAAVVFSADSEVVGLEASNLGYGSPWKSDDITALASVTLDIALGATRTIDTVIVGGNNIQAPYTLEFWDSDPAGGSLLLTAGPDLDSVVRENDLVVTPMQQAVLDANLNASPLRVVTPTACAWVRIIWDTTLNNGALTYLQASLVYAGLAHDLRTSVQTGNTLESDPLFEPQGSTSRTFEIPAFGRRSFPLDLTFVRPEERGPLEVWGTVTRASKGFAWRTPNELDSFAQSAFFGKLSGATGIDVRGANGIRALSGWNFLEERG